MYDLMQCFYTLAVVDSTDADVEFMVRFMYASTLHFATEPYVCLKPTDATVNHVSWMQHCPS